MPSALILASAVQREWLLRFPDSHDVIAAVVGGVIVVDAEE